MATVDIEEIKKRIKDNIKWEVPPVKAPMGGQHVSPVRFPPVTLYSEEIDVRITVGYHRSRPENKMLAYTLFTLALDELIY